MRALITARRYLSEDGIDFKFRPEFTKVEKEDGDSLSGVRFVLFAQQI